MQTVGVSHEIIVKESSSKVILLSFNSTDCVSQEACDKCLDQHSTCSWCSDRVRIEFLSSESAVARPKSEKQEFLSELMYHRRTAIRSIHTLEMLIRGNVYK